MHRGHRLTELRADVHDFRGAERVPLLHQLLQRAPLDELHPQSDAAVDPIGAEDGDDIGVVDTREQAPFFDDGRYVGVTGGRADTEELERHFAIDPRVPGAIDFSERAAADALEHAQVAPSLRRLHFPVDHGEGGERRPGRILPRLGHRRASMHAGDAGHEPETGDEWALPVVSARFCGVPVDRGIVENRGRQVSQ